MKTLNELVKGYTRELQQGEIQAAYKGIFDFLGKLRSEFIRRYPHFDVSGIYQGYMDMSYFSLSNKSLKERGLKIAIVYLHGNGAFEVWLSARNRDIAKNLASMLSSNIPAALEVFHDTGNPDAVVECLLTASPDFDDQAALTETIIRGAERFAAAVADRF